LIACNNQPAVLLRNDTPGTNSWVRLVLRGQGCNRDALGSRVQVGEGLETQTQYVSSGGSYLADHDRRLLFGSGAHNEVKVRVTWPCGAEQVCRARARESMVVEEAGCKLAHKETLTGKD
jgi:hypothetical protein